MIKIVKRSEINAESWDSFIVHSPQRLVYALSWYLDAVLQEWEAIIELDKNNQIVAVLPYQVVKKFFLKKVEQNAFSNELGVFCLNQMDPSRLLKTFYRHNKFISRYIFNTNNTSIFEKISYEITYHLKLENTYKHLFKNYSTNRKRNLKKALNAPQTIEESNSIDYLITLFKENVSNKVYGITDHQYNILKNIFTETQQRNLSFVLEARSNDGEVISSVLFIKSFERLIYFFAASSNKGKEYNSQTLLIDSVIQKYSNSNLVLDFEGGSIVGLARFYSSFGAIPYKIPKDRKMLGSKLLNTIRKLKSTIIY